MKQIDYCVYKVYSVYRGDGQICSVHLNLFVYYTKYLVELFHSVLIEQSSLWKGNRKFFLKSDS